MVGIDRVLLRIGAEKSNGCLRILERSGELRAWSGPVVDGCHDKAMLREARHQGGVTGAVTGSEPAAMNGKDSGMRTRAVGARDVHYQSATRVVHHLLFENDRIGNGLGHTEG